MCVVWTLLGIFLFTAIVGIWIIIDDAREYEREYGEEDE